MKKFLVFMLGMLLCTAALAQTESEHLTFKGIPIDGSVSSFVEKMEQKGFTYLTTVDDAAAVLKGSFAGYDNCEICVFPIKQKDLVYLVGVNFPSVNNWEALSTNYYYLKNMLTTKYGDPSACTETFDAYSQPEDDQMKMLYVETDKCKYISTYITPKGLISVVIQHIKDVDYQDYCNVSLLYRDHINYSKKQSQAIDDL